MSLVHVILILSKDDRRHLQLLLELDGVLAVLLEVYGLKSTYMHAIE